MNAVALLATGAVALFGFAIVDNLFSELQDELIDRRTGANLYRGFELELGQFLVASLIALTMLALAAVLRPVARTLSRQSMEAQVSLDPRPPILFLRSFENDQVRLPDRQRLDYVLVEKFSRYGPILAIGKPGETDLPFGAARAYVPEDEWKDTVLRLAKDASAIVLVADPSRGVGWEIETLLAGPARAKTILLASPTLGDVRNNPFVAAALGPMTNLPGTRAIAVYFDALDHVLVRARSRISAPTYIVALQAFFNRAMLKDQIEGIGRPLP